MPTVFKPKNMQFEVLSELSGTVTTPTVNTYGCQELMGIEIMNLHTAGVIVRLLFDPSDSSFYKDFVIAARQFVTLKTDGGYRLPYPYAIEYRNPTNYNAANAVVFPVGKLKIHLYGL